MRWLLALLMLPGCPLCDLDTELDVVEGSKKLRPGERVSLEIDSEGYHAGPDKCRGHWYVDEIEWGNADVGYVTNCGVYTATGGFGRARPFKVTVAASKSELGSCADCCAEQSLQLTIVD